ncbi:MAG TPA: VWA domain-containing protein, partial [Phycisphaerae bacterium]|nr:VWA domain-containing protein [Phycisphaerae bacterium]
MDRSDSVKNLLDTQERYLHEVSETIKDADDRVGAIDFARNAFIQQLPMGGGYHIAEGRLPEMENRDRTDIAAAIRLAMASFPSDSAKRIVLLSDGNDNMGDVLSEAARAQAEGIAIDVVPLWYEHRNEVYVDRMVAPTQVQDGDMVPLRIVLHAERATSGRIDLYHNGRLIPVPPEMAHVALTPGANPLIYKIPVHGGGPQRFEARFVPDEGSAADSIEENNYATAFSFVAGKMSVLMLSQRPDEDTPLVDALRSEKIDVEQRDVSAGEVDLLELMNYSTVILANVPANTFTREQQQTLAQYVENLGGGLIMTGGDESFGAGGWIGSPVAQVMPVDFEIKHKRVIPRGALVLIMHSCEIPRGNYWGVEVAKASVDTISSRDYIGVLAYSWSPGGVNWEVPFGIASNKPAIKKRIERMAIGDMPDFDSTMKMAVSTLKASDASQKHMIIISDGDPSAPVPAVINDMVRNKITCSTIGIGYGSHVMEKTLRDIASQTGGKFYPCRNPKLLPQIFVKESKVVRRSLISNERFTPQVRYAYSELLTGIGPDEVLPPLGGMVLTSPKPEAQIALVRVGEDRTEDPVLAHWQAGLGKAVAFTSGYWTHWGDAWVNWPKFSKLWAQIVRWSMRQEAPANFDVFTRIEGTKGRVIVDAMDKDAKALNMLSLPAVVIKPNQDVAPLLFAQTGPGHYEAEFDVDQTGQYIANVAVSEQGVHQGSIQTGVSVPFSPEFRELVTNEALLHKMVDMTGGRWHEDISQPAKHEIFKHNLPPVKAKAPIWDWMLAWILLPLFLLDVAVRRLASTVAFSIVLELTLIVVLLFGAGWVHAGAWGVLGAILIGEFIGWALRFRAIGPIVDFLTHSVTALGHTGERSTATIGQLKDVRDRVRDEGGQRLGGARKVESTRDEPAVDRQRRFDVGDAAASQPVQDLQESLGAPQAGAEPTPEKNRPPAPADKQDQGAEDATSRLLRAKRRARKEMDDDQNKGQS